MTTPIAVRSRQRAVPPSFRFAVIGCGRMGRERARAAALLGGSLVAACDVDAWRARELAAAHPGAAVIKHTRALDWSRLDAVFVCTPPFARGEIEVETVRAGVPLFIEKPVGTTAAVAVPLLQALDGSDLVNAVGYMNRYRRSVDEAKRVADERGVLGISAHWVASPYHVWWRESEELSGGGMNDEATHIIDLVRYLVGEITAVQAVQGSERPGDPSGTVAALLRFQNGAVGTLLYSGGSTVKQIGLRLHTASGEIRLETWDFNLHYDGRRVPGRPRGAERSAIFATEVQTFIEAVGQSNRLLVKSTIADAVRTQCVVDTLRESVKGGCALDVGQPGVEITA
jgi:predicted dehydrogenase